MSYWVTRLGIIGLQIALWIVRQKVGRRGKRALIVDVLLAFLLTRVDGSNQYVHAGMDLQARMC